MDASDRLRQADARLLDRSNKRPWPPFRQAPLTLKLPVVLALIVVVVARSAARGTGQMLLEGLAVLLLVSSVVLELRWGRRVRGASDSAATTADISPGGDTRK